MDTQPPPIPGRARSRVRTWILVNLFLWPGLGSWLGGRRAVGAVQMLAALLGSGVAVVWFVQLMHGLMRELQGARAESPQLGRLAFTGFGLLALAWLWSLATSLSLLRETRLDAPAVKHDSC